MPNRVCSRPLTASTPASLRFQRRLKPGVDMISDVKSASKGFYVIIFLAV
jgi:hypothetical protein